MNLNKEILFESVFNGISSNITINTFKEKHSKNEVEIEINGYKHSLIQFIACSIAINQKLIIENPPKVMDTYVMCAIINELGGEARIDSNKLVLDPSSICITNIPCNLSRIIHGSLYLMPALLIRFGKFEFFESGGCQIGDNDGRRPVNHIINVMKRFGAEIYLTDKKITGMLSDYKSVDEINIMDFSNSHNKLSGPLVGGATKVAMLMSFNQSKIIINNPYLKTDTLDLLNFIKLTGKNVEINKNKLIISGQVKISKEFLDVRLTECISEIITYSTFAILNDIKIKFLNLNKLTILESLKPELRLLSKMNVKYIWEGNDLIIFNRQLIESVNIVVDAKGIQSDHQPFFALLLLYGNKKSEITEKVFRNRFFYLDNLIELGADICRKENTIIIKPSKINNSSMNLKGHDVRTAAVTLIACLTANENCKIYDCVHLLRGYDDFVEKLRLFGCRIKCEVEAL